ncbi:unnamed protein product [Didymodactylos carnosus]|uniref:Uncharacterized protein n=1 Tax=Didymodactylos carnosus TaxID=1234261 RepID=A0A814DPV7_9BILA|nr:unnamed protein product [Didymodactylos carnosus]CAF3733509.1 unnamed protein product [Didymodactylos carnosus]
MKHMSSTLREKMSTAIKKMLNDDIIEHATGPTEWLLPAMAVPKKNGEIRIIDEIVSDIHDAKVFSKIDLR